MRFTVKSKNIMWLDIGAAKSEAERSRAGSSYSALCPGWTRSGEVRSEAERSGVERLGIVSRVNAERSEAEQFGEGFRGWGRGSGSL